MDPTDKFHSPLYIDHNQVRFDHFSSLGFPVQGKSILELGAGIGDHTAFLLSQGASRILSVEARDENIEKLYERFGKNENVTIVKMDIEHPQSLSSKFDIVYSYGLLYHLCNPEETLRWIADHAMDFMIMETCVATIKENKVLIVDEDKNNVTQSFSGKGCRPSRYWVMNKLKELFKYAYIPRTQPNHPEFPIDWNNIPNNNKLTRSIFIGSNKDLADNVKLSNEIIEIQTYI